MNDIKTGEWQRINGDWLRVVQTNAVTILVQNQKGEQFHINKKDIQMNDTSKELRKKETWANYSVEDIHVPAKHKLILSGKDASEYTTEELHDIVEGIADDVDRLKARKVQTSFTKGMASKLEADCAAIVAWMEANRGVVGGWTPRDLFKGGSWIDLTDISTLFQDREGTIPVTEHGQIVRMAKDKSGNGNHFYGEVVYQGVKP